MIKGVSLARRSYLNDVPYDARTIDEDHLNIVEKVRSNLLPWNGQFSPQLVHALLQTYSTPGDLVVDPFMGSGTVLIEAARLGRRAFGAEINPAACKMAQTYSVLHMQPEARRRPLMKVDDALHHVFSDAPLFAAGDRADHMGVKEKLLSLWSREGAESPAGKMLETLIVLLDFYKPDLTPQKVLATWRKLSRKIEELPFSAKPIQLVNCDARKLPLPPAAADLVVTSPPYINVFNYHQQYRASVEALGWDLLHVARSEIGSNRKNRGNRFLTVIQYCLDVAQALVEMRRVCKRSARMILVVGRESNVMKTRFFNGEIVTRLGVRCAGLAAESRQERVFKNKFGAMIYEDIIHFRPGSELTGDDQPEDVAREVLTEAMDHSPSKFLPDLEDAVSRLPNIKASPLYRPKITIARECK